MNDTCAAEAQRGLGSATAPQRLTCVLQDEPHPGLPRGSSRHPVLGTTGLLGHHTGQGLNPTAADTEQGMAWTWTAPQLRFHQPPPPRGHSPTRLRGDSPGGAQAGLSGDGGGCLEGGSRHLTGWAGPCCFPEMPTIRSPAASGIWAGRRPTCHLGARKHLCICLCREQ